MSLSDQLRSFSGKASVSNSDCYKTDLNKIVTPEYPQNPFEVLGEHHFNEPRTVLKEEIGTPVQEFYRNVNVFVTGGTGFVGIVLIEKLLRSCPHLNHIYILVRPKRNYSSQERFEKMFQDRFFRRLHHEVPHFRQKVSMINGCVDQADFALSNEDRETLVENVNVIFHCAATVRFNESLRKAVEINTLGTKEMIKLAKDVKNLKVLMYVSTIYAFCINFIIEEKIPTMDFDYEDIFGMLKIKNDDELKKDESKILKQWPNTYTFSKALTESMLQKECKGLPVGIFRPSTVISTFKEPVSGWVNNVYGPIGLLLGCGIGILHVFEQDFDVEVVDFVPVDFVVNALICATCDTYSKHKTACLENETILPVYNFVNGGEVSFTWRKLDEICSRDFPFLWPFSNTVWFPFVICTQNHYLYKVLSFCFHTLPGHIIDYILKKHGKKPILTNLYKKLEELENILVYFKQRKWLFKKDSVKYVWDNLSSADKELFFYDMKAMQHHSFFNSASLGMRVYQMKDDVQTLPAARKKIKRLYYIHKTCKFLFWTVVLYIAFLMIKIIFSIL